MLLFSSIQDGRRKWPPSWIKLEKSMFRIGAFCFFYVFIAVRPPSCISMCSRVHKLNNTRDNITETSIDKYNQLQIPNSQQQSSFTRTTNKMLNKWMK